MFGILCNRTYLGCRALEDQDEFCQNTSDPPALELDGLFVGGLGTFLLMIVGSGLQISLLPFLWYERNAATSGYNSVMSSLVVSLFYVL